MRGIRRGRTRARPPFMLGKCSGGVREGGSAIKGGGGGLRPARALSLSLSEATTAAATAVTKDSFVSAADSGYLRIQTIPFTIDGTIRPSA